MVKKMKKEYVILAISLATLACNKEQTSSRIGGDELIAVSETGTKAHLEGNKVIWDNGDAINVFTKNESGSYFSSKFATSESGTSVVLGATE